MRRHDVLRRAESRQGKLVPRFSSWCTPRLIMDRPRDGTTLCLHCTLVAAAKAPPLDSPHEYHAPLQTQRLSDFGIGLAAFTPRPWLLLAINDAPSEETSIDTFVQLVSLHVSGLIAIVRLQEVRLSGHSPADADLVVIAVRELG